MSPFLRAYFSRLSWTVSLMFPLIPCGNCICSITAPSPLKTSTSCFRVKSTLTMGRWKRS
ncbi:Uncharacterised protein [Klebsiella pneumoniae]|uniref:Uncharacterized protein n=1 Tax=Klebsiella pneumoniae TaxID=573 RepID=A0A377W3H9_KLEPN|nr:Uncharacterised protein [Klebsiella pneumoniae]